MLFAVDSSIFMMKNSSYQKYELKVNGEGQFYLEEAAGSLEKLPATYQVLTFAEVCAKFGVDLTPEEPAPKTTAAKRPAAKRTES